MPEETLPKATSAPESSKGGTLVLVIAILAFIAAIAAIVMNIVMKPDTSAIEAHVQAVETSVQTITKNVASLTEEQQSMKEDAAMMAEADMQKHNILETSDYTYDFNSGNLTSQKDGGILYTFSNAGKENKFIGRPAVHILGVEDGSKLILWETGSDNSPGPGWIYEIWLGDELEYIDLNNPSEGPRPYVVPEWKKQEAQEQLDAFEQSMQ